MDELETTQDAKTSGDEKETSKQTETFTREQLDEAERKGKSDGLVEVGRLTTENKRLVANSQQLTQRVEQMVKEQEDAELRAAEGNPEQLSAIKERQLRRQAESNLAQTKAELDEKDERIKQLNEKEAESTKERSAREIASRLGVDPKSLVKLAKFTDGSSDAIEEIAKELSGQKTLQVDSSRTLGGTLSDEQIIEDYSKDPDNPIFRERNEERRRRVGR